MTTPPDDNDEDRRPVGLTPHARPGPLQDSAIGSVLGDGRYKVIRRLGKGGMCEVYEVTHQMLGRAYALKTLRSKMLGNEEAVRRFTREASILARINYPHIVQVMEGWRLENGAPFYIMEMLDGLDLMRHMDRLEGPVPLEQTKWIVEQILKGLITAHNAGIVHRDLKPENVFLVDVDGRTIVKIIDFGISKNLVGDAAKSSPHLTIAGSVLGTPGYMSPEQCYADAVDHRSDLYSLGVMIYEMLTGDNPFCGKHESQLENIDIFERHRDLVPPPLSEVADVPEAISRVVEHCLQKKRVDRPHDGGEVLKAWRQAFDELEEAKQPPPLPGPVAPVEAPAQPVAVSPAEVEADDRRDWAQRGADWVREEPYRLPAVIAAAAFFGLLMYWATTLNTVPEAVTPPQAPATPVPAATTAPLPTQPEAPASQAAPEAQSPAPPDAKATGRQAKPPAKPATTAEPKAKPRAKEPVPDKERPRRRKRRREPAPAPAATVTTPTPAPAPKQAPGELQIEADPWE